MRSPYGLLAHGNLGKELKVKKRYEEEYMGVIAFSWERGTVELNGRVATSKEQSHSV